MAQTPHRGKQAQLSPMPPLTPTQDIKFSRQQKIRNGITQVLEHTQSDEPPNPVQLTDVAAMEVNAIRSTFIKVARC